MIKGHKQATRRQILRQAMTAGLAAFSSSYAIGQQRVDADHGRIEPPIDVPAIPLRCADGALRNLTELTRGKATAVQLMFAECTTTCPIQGAIFQRVQGLLPASARPRTQLLSISIDPENDTPQALREWLQRFQAGAGWTAAVPKQKDLAAVQSLFGKGRSDIGNHTTQVQILNQRSQLVWSSVELPSAESIVAVLSHVLG